MKKIVAVKGESNSGKTTSIKIALKNFLTQYPLAKITNLAPKNRVEVFEAVEINGITVVFASKGDSEKILQSLLEKIDSINWNVLVCATKHKGKTQKYIQNKQNSQVDVLWINKMPSLSQSNYQSENEETARQILLKVKSPPAKPGAY